MTSPDKSRARIAVIASLIVSIIAVGTLVANITTTTVKANQAHEYVKKNENLPEKVCVLEKKMDKAEKLIDSIGIMQNEQRHIITDMNELKDALKNIVENGKRTQ